MDQKQEKIDWSHLLGLLQTAGQTIALCGLSDSAAAYAASLMFNQHRRPMVIVVADTRAADQLLDELSLFVEDSRHRVIYFPPYNLMVFKHVAYHNETAAHRIGTLYQILESQQPPLVVTTVDALLQKLIPKSALSQFGELLIAGQEADRDALVHKLIAGGYTRTMIVEEPGDFSLRGGLVDLFSPLYRDPIRMEFYGDMVESLRHFSASTQRTTHDIDEAIVLPAREALISQNSRNAILGRIRKRAAQMELPATQIREMMQKMKQEGIFPGMESLLPLIYDRLDTLFDYLPHHTQWVLMAPGQLRAAADALQTQAEHSYQTAVDNGRLCVVPDQIYLKWPEVEQALKSFPLLSVRPIAGQVLASVQGTNQRICNVKVRDVCEIADQLRQGRDLEQPFQPFVQWVKKHQAASRATVEVCRRRANRERLVHLLALYDIEVSVVEDITALRINKPAVYLICGKVTAGFSWPGAGLAMITDEEIFGTAYRTGKVSKPAKAQELINYEELKQGDWVVHSEHGIGKYGGLVKLDMDRSMNDYLLIIYRDDDKLYLPVERMG